MNHVKENDLAHGQFEKWVENLGMTTSEARKFMTVAKRLPNRSTLNDLGSSALYLIATLPEEEKTSSIGESQRSIIKQISNTTTLSVL